MKIEKGKQKILLMGGIILGAILIFWVFIYSPKNKQMKELKDKLVKVQKDINTIHGISRDKESLDIVITKYNEKLKELELKLPQQEESTLRGLVTEATKKSIEVPSIRPKIATDCKLPINIEEYKCKELDISIELVTSYKNLGEYLRILKNKFPSLVRLNELKIEKKGEEKGISKLSVLLEITLYMLVPEIYNSS